MRVCLITPGHLSTNPRLVKEADALSEAGHEVRVLAAQYLPWAREADREFAARPWRIEPSVSFGHHAPRARRLGQLLRNRSARWLVKNGAGYPVVLRAACHSAAPDLARAAAHIDAELYIAHNLAALPAAALAARRAGAAYAFDAEDFHSGEFDADTSHALDHRVVGMIERRYLPGCAYVTAASPLIAGAYAEAYSIARPTVVLNLFPRSQAPSGPTPRGSSATRPSVYWFSQTIGPNRGLETAVRAIARAASRPHLFLRGAPASGFEPRLQRLAEELGVGDRLHLLPPSAPGDLERLATAYDVGYSGEPGHVLNNRLALGNKLFSYLLAGVPIVASDVTAHRALAPELLDAIRLFAAGDAQSLAEALDGYLSADGVLANARTTAFRLGQERFNWDVEKRVLLGCVEGALGGRGGAGR